MTFLSLCSGCGGLDLGLERGGFKCVGQVEIMPYALKVLKKHLAESPEIYQHLDLICFGFPCQDISKANPKGKGLEGEKSSIFFECMRVVNILNPDWILIENVPSLLSIHEGRDFGIVLRTLAESGYGYSWRILDSQYWGVAQRRRRLFIIARFGKFCPPEILSEQEGCGRTDPKKQARGQTSGLCISTRDGKRHDPTSETLVASTIQATDYNKVQYGRFGNEGNLVASTLQAEGHGRSSKSHVVAHTVHTERRGVTGKIWQNNYIAQTDPKRKREIAGISSRLDTRRGIVLGNAVTVPVAQWIGERIARQIQKEHDCAR